MSEEPKASEDNLVIEDHQENEEEVREAEETTSDSVQWKVDEVPPVHWCILLGLQVRPKNEMSD